MENASKAIVMAGAVMIAVLVISLFLWFLTSIQQYGDDMSIQKMSSDAQAFNRYFVYSYSEGLDGTPAVISSSEAYNIIMKVLDINARDDYHHISLVIDKPRITSDIVEQLRPKIVPTGPITENTDRDAIYLTFFNAGLDENTKLDFNRDNFKVSSYENMVYEFDFTYGRDGFIDTIELRGVNT